VTEEEWQSLEVRIGELRDGLGIAVFADERVGIQAQRAALDAFLLELRERDEAAGIPSGYLTGPHWARLRISARVLSGFRCVYCGRPPRDTHHTSYLRTGRELHEDVVVLCGACHRAQHGFDFDFAAI
jgi:hypothetical protein